MRIFLLFLLLINSISQANAQEDPKYYNSKEHLNRNPHILKLYVLEILYMFLAKWFDR